ncbi:helix-turn-helix domain-containing protein [Methanolobus mangrovi]|uniref:Helix-turn-helix domain-containing protein n=1 Tax=Methanolobus mangrovi TaxID=3072977 RepID=A0AA51YGV6_9EURY|nr:helix-turn-helix domain-containing protein [Methanolobus mangrovi]WMW22472.1 helix-turn-helix domain-containing protein [Methanolobus mangrovi]
MLLTSLQKLGFTSYEAKVFVALVKNESATVSTLHLDSGVPNSAIYGALKKLEQKGIIEFQNTKPMRYRCILPEDAILKLKRDYGDECDNVLDQLNRIYGECSTNKSEELMWTINGIRNVTDRVMQMFEGAQKEIIILSSSTPFYKLADRYKSLKKDYTTMIGILNKKTTDEGVSLKLISSCEEEARKLSNIVPLASVRINSMEKNPLYLKSFVVVVDNSEMLVDILKDDDGEADLTAIWTNGKEFSSTMSHLLNAKWETSTEYHPL